MIFVFIGRLTKYTHFISISSKAKATLVAYSYVKNVFKLHGFHKVIVSDKDPKFTNNFWKELFHQVGTSLTMSTPYHPQIDGQTEVVNKCLEGYMMNLWLTDKFNGYNGYTLENGGTIVHIIHQQKCHLLKPHMGIHLLEKDNMSSTISKF